MDNSCRSRDSNTQPRVTSPKLYPLEPRLPRWCTDNSFSSLPVNLSQVFESALLVLILKLACAPFPTPFLPVNVAFNILWCSTLWTATPFCDLPSLWRVSMIVFWTIAKSAVFPLLWSQRTRDTPNLYCMDDQLLKLKCKYSKMLRYWVFDFHELKILIIKIKTKLLKFHFLKCYKKKEFVTIFTFF